MFEFHKDKQRYFEIQYVTARDHIMPFIEKRKQMDKAARVLEIGCGEAGVLKAFRERGCNCVGIELSESRTVNAEKFHSAVDAPGKIRFINKDIYDINVAEDIGHKFDLIILKDVIEHIPNQERFIPQLKEFLEDDGVVFFGFPPWYMPFGGHQQVCRSGFLSKLPYFHLLPTPLFQAVLRLFGEREKSRKNLQDIKETGISIERFERIVRQNGLRKSLRQLWFLNPIYKYKFGKGPIRQTWLIGSIPFVRNFFTTAVYYIIEREG